MRILGFPQFFVRRAMLLAAATIAVTAVAQEPKFSNDDQAAIAAALRKCDLPQVTQIMDQWKLTPESRIWGGKVLEVFLRQSAGQEDEPRITMLEFLTKRGELEKEYWEKLSAEDVLQSIGPKTTMNWVKNLSSKGAPVLIETNQKGDNLALRAVSQRNLGLLESSIQQGSILPPEPVYPWVEKGRFYLTAPSPACLAISGADYSRDLYRIGSSSVKSDTDPAVTKFRIERASSGIGTPDFLSESFDQTTGESRATVLFDRVIAAGADPNAPDAFRRTALHYAVWAQWSGLYEKLVGLGLDPATEDIQGRGLIHFAVSNPHRFDSELFGRIMAAAVDDPLAADSLGQTPLHVATAGGHLDAIQMLISLGADPLRQDHAGNAPTSLLWRRDDREEVEAILAEANPSTPTDAVTLNVESAAVPAILWVKKQGDDSDGYELAVVTVEAQFKEQKNDDFANLPTQLKFSKNDRQAGERLLNMVDAFRGAVRTRQDGWPLGSTIYLSCDRQYLISSSMVASSLPWALAVNSMVSGRAIDSSGVVIAGIDAEGVLTAPEDLIRRVRFARKSGKKWVGVAASESMFIHDLFLAEGPAQFSQIPIFILKDFEAAEWASQIEKSAVMTEANTTFAQIAKVLGQEGGMKHLTHPKMIEKLESIVGVVPQHGSAWALLRLARGEIPAQMSRDGSRDHCRSLCAPFWESVVGGTPPDEAVRVDDCIRIQAKLRALRSRVHEEMLPMCDALADYANFVKGWIEYPPKSELGQTQMLAKMDAQRKVVELAIAPPEGE